MNALPTELLRQAQQLSEEVTRPIPGSRKIHVEGSRPDLQVPMREIALTQTPTIFGGEDNPPVTVYDTSGPYTDPDARTDLSTGLPALRELLSIPVVGMSDLAMMYVHGDIPQRRSGVAYLEEVIGRVELLTQQATGDDRIDALNRGVEIRGERTRLGRGEGVDADDDGIAVDAGFGFLVAVAAGPGLAAAAGDAQPAGRAAQEPGAAAAERYGAALSGGRVLAAAGGAFSPPRQLRPYLCAAGAGARRLGARAPR